MACSTHLIAKIVPGYGPLDGRCFPCSGVSGKATSISSRSTHGDQKFVTDVKFLSLRCSSSSRTFVCYASSGGHRRNPDFPRQNRQGFSRNRNRYNEEKDNYDNLEDSEMLSSKNGPLLSLSGNSKFQATSTPGPREKEIVELFRKVQAQLRERAALKEEKKIEASQEKGKESETVDSLLKLLRKHSVQQGKKTNNNAGNRDFILDQPEQMGTFADDKSTSSLDSNTSVDHETQESQRPHVSRPKSSFRRLSPVPQVKFQPVHSEDSDSPVSHGNLEGKRKEDGVEELKVKSFSESDAEETFPEVDVFDELSDDEASEIFESEEDDEEEEENQIEVNLTEMKLPELRALAKSRGMKGYSKLKKHELIELLSGSTD